VFSRDATNGALMFMEIHKGGGGRFGRAQTATISPDGKHVYVAGQGYSVAAVYSRNSTTGALTFLEFHRVGLGGLAAANALTVSPDGKYLYAADRRVDAVAVYSRNPTTGTLTFLEAHIDGVGRVDGLSLVESVTASPDGRHLYAASPGDSAVAVFTVSLPASADLSDTDSD